MYIKDQRIVSVMEGTSTTTYTVQFKRVNDVGSNGFPREEKETLK